MYISLVFSEFPLWHCIVQQALSVKCLLFCTKTSVQYLAGVVLDAEAVVWQAVVGEEL